MILSCLRVLHSRHSASSVPQTARALAPEGALVIETCQRSIWIFPTDVAAVSGPGEPECGGFREFKAGEDVFQGWEAYRFLLKVAVGLESELQGETDIFGQIKTAWAKYEMEGGAHAADLRPWIGKLFEDAKEVRANFLQGLGGSSYGSLVRAILRRHDLQGPVLLVGAGQISRSVGPWLEGTPLWIHNRSQESAEKLAADLRSPARSASARAAAGGSFRRSRSSVREDVTAIDSRDPSALAAAWREAAHVVIGIPLDRDEDARRIAWRRETRVPGAVIHLGGARKDCGDWLELPFFHALDDLFALEKAQALARSQGFARAMKACDERARLRWLGAQAGLSGGSAALAHGWEDLAVFASPA